MKLIICIFLFLGTFSTQAQSFKEMVGKWSYKGLYQREKYFEKTAADHDLTYGNLIYIFKEAGQYTRTGFRNDEAGEWYFQSNLMYVVPATGGKQLFQIQSYTTNSIVVKVGVIFVILEREVVPGQEVVEVEPVKKSTITVFETTKDETKTVATPTVEKEKVEKQEAPAKTEVKEEEEKVKFSKDEKFLYTIPAEFLLSDFTDGRRFLPEYRNNKPPYYVFTITDKTKKVVFQSTDPLVGWDGIREDTKKMIKKGVYSWKIEYKIKKKDEYKVATGTLTVK